ncbi:hypothetical protein QAD02_004328 [Eretmocerus hayati]|uniref:Uncharacterized protein n=1 Tax=Eretmocerus hayati TaxID=131215 RepID=A0ACC2NPM8_9HYME|nr:hypothetical protein QAD02_004328 [Eretmocerus hayati]
MNRLRDMFRQLAGTPPNQSQICQLRRHLRLHRGTPPPCPSPTACGTRGTTGHRYHGGVALYHPPSFTWGAGDPCWRVVDAYLQLQAELVAGTSDTRRINPSSSINAKPAIPDQRRHRRRFASLRTRRASGCSSEITARSTIGIAAAHNAHSGRC